MTDVELFPPCQDCGSFGMPADLEHNRTTYRCLNCARRHYADEMPDVLPQLDVAEGLIIALRSDPTSRSYWGVPA